MKSSDLLREIEDLRHKMIETAVNKGFSSNESIRTSRKLDELLNQYEKLKKIEYK